MCQPYIESATALSDISMKTNTVNKIPPRACMCEVTNLLLLTILTVS